jgi:hypothetical protein
MKLCITLRKPHQLIQDTKRKQTYEADSSSPMNFTTAYVRTVTDRYADCCLPQQTTDMMGEETLTVS